MKKFLLLSFLSPLSACAAAPWSGLDADPASPTFLRAPEAPRPTLAAVLADADPLHAPSGIASGTEAQRSPTGHHGEHAGHGQQTEHGGHAGHGQQTEHGEHAGHGAKQGSTRDEHKEHSGSAPDAATPAPGHNPHQH